MRCVCSGPNNTYSPRSRGHSAVTSPTATNGPAGSNPTGAAQGAFFPAYPVPPPPQHSRPGTFSQAIGGGAVPPPGPPSAYANMVLGPDGKASFAPQGAHGAFPPQPFGDPHMASYHQYPGGNQQYGARRYNRSSNGFASGGGYNGNRQSGGGRGGQRHYQQQQQQPPGHMTMNGYMQPVPPIPQVAQQSEHAAPSAIQEQSTGEDTPRSGAGSTTVDGSTPDEGVPAPSASVDGVHDSGAGGSLGGVPGAAHQYGPGSGPVPAPTALAGHPGPFVNFVPSGAAPYFPNYPFNGVPLPFAGFVNAPGVPPAGLSPMNFAAPPNGFFRLPMSPAHNLQPHMAFQYSGQYAPQQHLHYGGGEGAHGGSPRQHGQHQRHFGGPGGPPRTGTHPVTNSAQFQSNLPRPPQQQQSSQGARGSPRTGASGPAPQAPSADSGEAGGVPPAGGAVAEKRGGANDDRTTRERKDRAPGTGAVADKEVANRAGSSAGKTTPEATTPAGDTAAASAAASKRRGNGANNEGTANKRSGGAGTATESSGRKGGEKGGADRKKGKNRADKGETAPAPAPVKRADFNMEADFPTLVSTKQWFSL
jgi:hypothetical protein